jgi:hypothetical protein
VKLQFELFSARYHTSVYTYINVKVIVIIIMIYYLNFNILCDLTYTILKITTIQRVILSPSSSKREAYTIQTIKQSQTVSVVTEAVRKDTDI